MNSPKHTTGEVILLWTIPFILIVWLSAFLLFPGFTHPMSPAMSPDEVAAFYRDAENLPRIRYSMIIFNWFCLGIIPVIALIMMQIQRMGHRTPVMSYCLLGCACGGPTLFLMANLFWLLAAFRPDRNPELTLLFNDMAWITFTGQVGFFIGQCFFLAVAIYLDQQIRPVFNRWVAHFNLLIAALLMPAAFVGLTLTGPIAWDGILSFWVKNIAIGVWFIIMGLALGKNIYHQREVREATA